MYSFLDLDVFTKEGFNETRTRVNKSSKFPLCIFYTNTHQATTRLTLKLIYSRANCWTTKQTLKIETKSGKCLNLQDG